LRPVGGHRHRVARDLLPPHGLVCPRAPRMTSPAPTNPAPEPLPGWLCASEPYEPEPDRDNYLRKNLLKLASIPARLSPTQEGAAVDKILAAVPAALRLLGLVVAVACVSAATNMAFVWVVLGAALVSLATRPLTQLRAIAPVAFVGALIAGLVALPSVLMGLATPATVTRLASKTLCTLVLTLSLAQGVPWRHMAGALSAAHVPAALIFVIDGAVRGIAMLGRVATQLTEALSLRSVGKNHDKSASAGAVMGMTFLLASAHAHAQAEAMACRGFDGSSTATPQHSTAAARALYLLLLCGMVAAFVWFEQQMGA
ncbi:MAG: energy-coupling factor transporter transmembrane component T, partial [Coriobacteriales bacterium]|nr:energy-coupling factor transporter transmembrane component T [Coriobacteriales bacterium]